MKLIIKENCEACNKVKEYLQTRPEIKIEYSYETPYPYSQTYPTLITDWGFITISDKIIEYLKNIK